MLKHGVVTLNGAAQNLKTALAAPDNVDRVRFIEFQPDGANVGVIYIGGGGSGPAPDTLSNTNYGTRLEIGAAGVPPAPWRQERELPEGGALKLSDFQVLGTNNEKLHVLWEPLI